MDSHDLPRLHILTDTVGQNRFSHFELAEMAFSAGNIAVQYRNKNFDPARDLPELMRIAEMARREKKCLIINDDAELAFHLGAQGVHLGKDDGSQEEAGRLLGPDAVIGVTVHDYAEMHAAAKGPASYLGVGPVFGTQSKDTGLPDLGLAGLRNICRLVPTIPVIGIGNIRWENIPEVMVAGAYGVAVMSAFTKADQPAVAAKALIERIEASIHMRGEED